MLLYTESGEISLKQCSELRNYLVLAYALSFYYSESMSEIAQLLETFIGNLNLFAL